MIIIIDDPKYGVRSEFDSVAAAQAALCETFPGTILSEFRDRYGDWRIRDESGDCVGMSDVDE